MYKTVDFDIWGCVVGSKLIITSVRLANKWANQVIVTDIPFPPFSKLPDAYPSYVHKFIKYAWNEPA